MPDARRPFTRLNGLPTPRSSSAAPRRKTHVIPFGANVDAPPASAIDSMLRARGSSPLNVLFSGREWARKGGNLAVEACRLAREAGHEVILHVVGVEPEVVPTDSFIVVHGVLDKRHPVHREICGICCLCATCSSHPRVQKPTGCLSAKHRRGRCRV